LTVTIQEKYLYSV